MLGPVVVHFALTTRTLTNPKGARGPMRLPVLALLLLAPSVLVGAAIALSPDPSGPWAYPLGQRLLYVHVPLAWASYAGFAASVVAALAVLRRGRPFAGRVMRASNEVTTLFAAGALATGLAWSYEFALYDPLADPKVLTTLVLVAALAGMWTLAASARRDRRDRLVASLTLVAFAAVPASYVASRLASPHPDFATGTELSAEMGILLLVASVGFVMLHAGLVVVRARLMALEEVR